MIKGIVAVDQHWGIGKKGGLLFKLPADMANFRATTLNSIVVMGENTLLSFPGSKPLKNRVNVVLCPEGHEYENCICIHDFEQLVKFVKILAKQYDVWVIGGGMMYRSMLPYYDYVLVTKVESADPEATVFFPNLDEDTNYTCIDNGYPIEDNNYTIRFTVYQRCDN